MTKKHQFNILIFVLLISCPLHVKGQDKKAVKHKLKSITEYEQKYEKGAAGKALKQSEIQYDSDGYIIEEIEYKLGKVNKHIKFEYDTDHNKIRETEFDPSGKKMKVTEYKYNDGLKTEKTEYDANNKILSRKTFKYETF